METKFAVRLTHNEADALRAIVAKATGAEALHLLALVNNAQAMQREREAAKPLTPRERTRVCEHLIEQLSDLSTREMLEEHVQDWDDYDWRIEFDIMNEYMND